MMQQYLLVPALVEALDTIRLEEQKPRHETVMGGWPRLNAIIAALFAPAMTMM